METRTKNETVTQYLTFLIAGEEYAINILQVREVLEFDTLTKVPTMPACVRGVVNRRGNVVPVVDLALKFGLPESVITRRTCIVMVDVQDEDERMVMGIMADSVSQVIDLGDSDIEPPPAFGTRVKMDYLVGMGKLGRKFAMLLDIDKLLATEELLTTADAAAEEIATLEAEPGPSDEVAGDEPTDPVPAEPGAPADAEEVPST